MTARRSSRRKGAKGWDAFATPVPGDALSCMEELGLEIIRVNGDEAQAKCPAHFERTGKEDRHPSFSVNIEEGVFGCFSCGFRGPFVALVEYLLKCDRDAAVGWVRARGGIERVKRALDESSGLKLLAIDTTLQINEASLALFIDPPAEALAKRNISLASAQHYGVLWDAEHDRWITPIRDPDTGKLWGWQAKNERYFRNRPTEVTKSKTLFGLEQFVEGDIALLVESPLDVLRIHTAGVDGGLSSFGAGVSTDQIKLIQTVADVLISGLDNDKDGTTYSRWLKATYGHKMVLKFLNYADFDEDIKDPGDMTNEQIRHSISTAIPSNLIRF
jgi:DNA primase